LRTSCLALVGVISLVLVGPSGGADSPSATYSVVERYSIPGQGSWDYISIDSEGRRLYVSHEKDVEVLDADTGRVVGQIPNTPGVHGAAIAPELKRGFISNGLDKSVTIFDTETLKPVKKVSVKGTDFILFDPFTKRVFPMDERITVLDAKTGDKVGEVDLNGSPEAAASDGKGTVYVNLADKNAVAVVDAQGLRVKTTYPIDSCTSPHSMAYDSAKTRLFVGCRDGLAILDATNGKVVGRSLICSGVDAAGFDSESKLIFESCTEGVMSVIREVSPNYYELVDTVKTQLWAKTMAFDPKTKKIFLPTAEFEMVPNTDPKSSSPFEWHMKIGSFTILVVGAAQKTERVTAIEPPATMLPPEAQSQGITRFSFIVYGDTRGRRDGVATQYEHSLIVDSMLAQIKRLQGTLYPVRFVLQSGDAVVNGSDAHQWNVSFVPLINRLTTESGVPYFLVPGNHDVTGEPTADAPRRQSFLQNYLDAVSALIPADGSQRRLSGYPTYAFGYGNTFVLGLDANIAGDEKQYQWAKSQLEGLDRSRYINVIVFCHQAPFSSGPHGGASIEPQTLELRSRYMPLFHSHHVRALFSGHEHLFEHWVEHYTDAMGLHRMDLVVSGGGGAPIYAYTGEPDLRDYLKRNEANKDVLDHLVKPGVERGSNPYHFVVVRVDGDRLDMEVIGVDWGSGFQPYRSNRVELHDE
jgi:hypothetical protein